MLRYWEIKLNLHCASFLLLFAGSGLVLIFIILNSVSSLESFKGQQTAPGSLHKWLKCNPAVKTLLMTQIMDTLPLILINPLTSPAQGSGGRMAKIS